MITVNMTWRKAPTNHLKSRFFVYPRYVNREFRLHPDYVTHHITHIYIFVTVEHLHPHLTQVAEAVGV